jgi:hypothetical protein
MDTDGKLQNETSAQKTVPVVSGKTIGDVLDAILIEPRRGFALILLLAMLSGLAILIMFLVTRLFQVRTSEIELGEKDSHVVFQRVQENTGNTEYLVIVNPEGWQTTGIDVKTGDHVTIAAGGKISIDINDIWKKIQLREKYEDELVNGPPFIRRNDPQEARTPEDFFTNEQKKSLILHRPWVDPSGFSLDVFQPEFRSRRDRYLLPDKPAGGLVAAVKDGPNDPTRPDAFFVGRDKEFVAAGHGTLWFTVNDVLYNDPKNPNLFYNDNFGSFWVRITVKHG